MSAPMLPKRNKSITSPACSKFSELLQLSDEEFKKCYRKQAYLDDSTLVRANFDFVNKLIQCNSFCFYSHDYDLLKEIHDSFDFNGRFILQLIDDFENRDRSYIDVSAFDKCILELPLAYAFWIDANQDLIVNCYTNNLFEPFSDSGLSPLKLDDIKRIREVIYELAQQCRGLDEVDKLMVVSNYLQNRVQFVDAGNISEASDGVYITDSRGITVNEDSIGNISNVLFNRFGVCRGISNTVTVLLNNPEMNVNARSTTGSHHTWNIIRLNEGVFYHDTTWSISRNPLRYPQSLKAQEFCSNYLLFGTETANRIGSHAQIVLGPSVSHEDYPSIILSEKQKVLSKKFQFNSYEPPVFESHIRAD